MCNVAIFTHSSPGQFILTGQIGTSKGILSLYKTTKKEHCKSCKVSNYWPVGINEHFWNQETCQMKFGAIEIK